MWEKRQDVNGRRAKKQDKIGRRGKNRIRSEGWGLEKK
jgi:hypothetical protein